MKPARNAAHCKSHGCYSTKFPSSKNMEELSTTVSVVNTGMSNQDTIFEEPVSMQLSQKKTKTVKYEQAEVVLLK
jgi:hypothetical protein